MTESEFLEKYVRGIASIMDSGYKEDRERYNVCKIVLKIFEEIMFCDSDNLFPEDGEEVLDDYKSYGREFDLLGKRKRLLNAKSIEMNTKYNHLVPDGNFVQMINDLISIIDDKLKEIKLANKNKPTTIHYALFYYYMQQGSYEPSFEDVKNKRNLLREKGKDYGLEGTGDAFVNLYYRFLGSTTNRAKETNIPHLLIVIKMLEDFPRAKVLAEADFKMAQSKSKK